MSFATSIMSWRSPLSITLTWGLKVDREITRDSKRRARIQSLERGILKRDSRLKNTYGKGKKSRDKGVVRRERRDLKKRIDCCWLQVFYHFQPSLTLWRLHSLLLIMRGLHCWFFWGIKFRNGSLLLILCWLLEVGWWKSKIWKKRLDEEKSR